MEGHLGEQRQGTQRPQNNRPVRPSHSELLCGRPRRWRVRGQGQVCVSDHHASGAGRSRRHLLTLPGGSPCWTPPARLCHGAARPSVQHGRVDRARCQQGVRPTPSPSSCEVSGKLLALFESRPPLPAPPQRPHSVPPRLPSTPQDLRVTNPFSSKFPDSQGGRASCNCDRTTSVGPVVTRVQGGEVTLSSSLGPR